jgi:hypothetical protein
MLQAFCGSRVAEHHDLASCPRGFEPLQRLAHVALEITDLALRPNNREYCSTPLLGVQVLHYSWQVLLESAKESITRLAQKASNLTCLVIVVHA